MWRVHNVQAARQSASAVAKNSSKKWQAASAWQYHGSIAAYQRGVASWRGVSAASAYHQRRKHNEKKKK